MKKTNVKKLRNLIIFLLAIFLIFIILLNTSHNYNLEYTIKDVKVNENYHKKAKYYSFVFTYENNEYEVISFDKYTNKRKLVKDISISKENDNTCLSFTSKYVNLYDVCKSSDTFYYKNNNNDFKTNKTYKNTGFLLLFSSASILFNR